MAISASVWLKAATCCLALGTLLFVIGFATDHWMTSSYLYTESGYGLWNGFSSQGSRTRTFDITSSALKSMGWTAFYRATQAFECMGLILQCIALLLALMIVFCDRARKPTPLIALILCGFAAVVCMVIGFCVFALKLENYGFSVGWSMGVAMAGCVLTFLASILALMHRCV